MTEKQNCDRAADDKANGVVSALVALHRATDLLLHYGNAGKLDLQLRIHEILIRGAMNFVYDVPHARAFRDFRIKSENNQGEASVLRQQIAANDLVGRHALDKLMVGGCLLADGRGTTAPEFGRLPGADARKKSR